MIEGWNPKHLWKRLRMQAARDSGAPVAGSQNMSFESLSFFLSLVAKSQLNH